MHAVASRSTTIRPKARTGAARVTQDEAVGAKAVPRRHNRLVQLLDCAARVFAQRGYAAASVREIVQPIGMLPGSLYYHFPTKEDLLVAVYREGVDRLSVKLDAAVAKACEPWPRLEAACVAHCKALLDSTDYSQVVIRVRPKDAPPVADQLTTLRDSYEARFEALIAALPLPAGIVKRDVRLFLMGALNGTQTWYREDGPLRPADIARRFIRLLKTDLTTG